MKTKQEVKEEISCDARKILAKNGMADHKFAFEIYVARDLNPPPNTIAAVCDYYGVDFNDVIKESRKGDVVRIRQIIAWLLYYESGLNHKAIGKLINRDRATIIHSLETINGYMRFDHELSDRIELLRGMVNNYGE